MFSTGITTTQDSQEKYVKKVKPKEVSTEIAQPKNRYYVEEKESDEDVEQQLHYKRRKLGDLPSYIPID